MSADRKEAAHGGAVSPGARRGRGREGCMKWRWLLPILCSLGLVLVSLPASAALLFSGGEDIDFLCTNTCTVDTNTAHFRSNWAREAYWAVPNITDPPANYFSTPVFTGNSTIWVHGQYWNNGTGNTSNGSQMIRVLDTLGNPTLIIRGTGTAGTVKISSRSASGAFTDLKTCSGGFPDVNLEQVDVYINYGTSGEVTLYKDSVSVCDYTGNVTNGDGATALNQVQFAGALNASGDEWSEVIIATTDTRAMARFTANTAGDGNTTGFSGTNICSAIWNVTKFNDANYGYSGSNNVLQECTINSSIPAGAYSVVGLVMSARALIGSTGPQHFDFLTRTNSTDYPSSDFAPTNSFSNITNYIQSVNPATSNPWAVSDFQATGFNVGEETKP